MIDYPELSGTEGENIKELARKLKQIDKVLLVRYHPVINPKKLEEYGEGTFVFTLFIEKQPGDPYDFEYRAVHQYVPKAGWNNPSIQIRERNDQLPMTGHDTIVSRFTNTVKYYLDNPTSNLTSVSSWTEY